MCHVLIIEDEFLIAMALEQMLAEQGATSFAFASTEENAVALAMQRRPDFITSDVTLDQGTGPQAVRTIHERLGLIPTIYITGTPEAFEPCCQSSIILKKPVDERQLAKAFYCPSASQGCGLKPRLPGRPRMYATALIWHAEHLRHLGILGQDQPLQPAHWDVAR